MPSEKFFAQNKFSLVEISKDSCLLAAASRDSCSLVAASKEPLVH
jgi:hypothetical protein